MAETVFILGAGASKEAGAPLMSDFITKARDLAKRKEITKDKDDFGKIFNVISDLQSVYSKSYLDLDNIEDVFGAIEMGKLIGKLGSYPTQQITDLDKAIKNLIVRTLEESTRFPVQNEHVYPPSPHKDLLELFWEKEYDRLRLPCSLLTFNYDITMDYTLNYYLDGMNYCLQDTSTTTEIKLLKLHGSLNWGFCDSCQKIIPITIKEFFQKRHFIDLRNIENVPIKIWSELGSQSKCPQCSNSLITIPVLVPPTWNKTEYHTQISKVWKQAAIELGEAENIFIIGYSFPTTDQFFRYLFALGSIGSAKIRRFWIFNPDGDVEKRMETIIGQGIGRQYKFFKNTFAEAIPIIKGELKIQD